MVFSNESCINKITTMLEQYKQILINNINLGIARHNIIILDTNENLYSSYIDNIGKHNFIQNI